MLTIMTYNVHGCLGLDRRRSPARIADLIERCNPDVIALQELDLVRRRSGFVDQAHHIAELLGMTGHYYTTVENADGRYGGAVLSRHRLHKVKSGLLPARRSTDEPRGALWVEVQRNGHAVNVLNTHLGLNRSERHLQVDSLLGSGWGAHPRFNAPAIICGDFNMTPLAQPWRKLAHNFREVRGVSERRRRWAGTWFGVRNLDHIFVTPDVRVLDVQVLAGWQYRLASDHLPMLAVIDDRATQTEQTEEHNPRHA
ncbi:MAG: endonuclease/exonuclease/phosphatase family protein [Candidatus Hydrogenedentota bacterium]